MKFYLIAAALGCALLSLATCSVVAEKEHSLIQLAEVPQNAEQQVAIAAEPSDVASLPQLEKILSQMPDQLMHEPLDGQMMIAATEENVNSSPVAVGNPQEASIQNNREPKQLIGFIPTYMLRQAMRQGQNHRDEQSYDASDEVEEERAIRRRKRFRRRNTRGHMKASRRHKNINKRKHKKNKRVNSVRKTQNRQSSLRKKKAPRNKNRRTRNRVRPQNYN